LAAHHRPVDGRPPDAVWHERTVGEMGESSGRVEGNRGHVIARTGNEVQLGTVECYVGGGEGGHGNVFVTEGGISALGGTTDGVK